MLKFFIFVRYTFYFLTYTYTQYRNIEVVQQSIQLDVDIQR